MANGQKAGGESSSVRITMSSCWRFGWSFSHLFLCWSWARTSLRQRTQKPRSWLTSCHLLLRVTFAMRSWSGSGNVKVGYPTRKWPGVSATGSCASVLVGQSGLELRQVSILAPSVKNSSNVSSPNYSAKMVFEAADHGFPKAAEMRRSRWNEFPLGSSSSELSENWLRKHWGAVEQSVQFGVCASEGGSVIREDNAPEASLSCKTRKSCNECSSSKVRYYFNMHRFGDETDINGYITCCNSFIWLASDATYRGRQKQSWHVIVSLSLSSTVPFFRLAHASRLFRQLTTSSRHERLVCARRK